MRMPHLVRRQHVIRRRIFAGCEGDSEVSYIALVVAHRRGRAPEGRSRPQLLQLVAVTRSPWCWDCLRKLLCGAIVTPMEGAYGNQERDPGRFAGGA